MRKSNKFGAFVCAVLSIAVAPAASEAAVFFSQDFETGLTGAESIVAVSPGFGRTNTATLGNGTFGVGHTQGYVNGLSVPTDYYQVTLNLTGRTGTTFAFDFSLQSESSYDEFGLQANGVQLAPTSGFVPNDCFDFGTGSCVALSGTQSGRAVYNLSAFDGQPSVTVQILLAPDFSITSAGFFIDNVVASDTSAVPEPGTMALLGVSILGLAASRRRRSTANA